MQVEHSLGEHPFLRSPHYRGLCAPTPAGREQQRVGEDASSFLFGEQSRRTLDEDKKPARSWDVGRGFPTGDGSTDGHGACSQGVNTAPQLGLARIRQLETRLMARESKVRGVLDSALDFFENPFHPPEREDAEDWEESNGGGRAFSSLWQPDSDGDRGEGEDELDSLEGEDEELEMEDDEEDEWVPPFAADGPAPVAPSPRWSQGPWSSGGGVVTSLSKKSSLARTNGLSRPLGGGSAGAAGHSSRKGDSDRVVIDDGSSMAGFPGVGTQDASETAQPVKRKRGRPKGSGKKNKASAAPPHEEAAAAWRYPGQVAGGCAAPAAKLSDCKAALEGSATGTGTTPGKQKHPNARSLQHLAAEDGDRAICKQLPKLRIPTARTFLRSEADNEEEEEQRVVEEEEGPLGEDGEHERQPLPELVLPPHKRKRGRPLKASRVVGGSSTVTTPSHLCTASTIGLEPPSPPGDAFRSLQQQQHPRNRSHSPPDSACSDFTHRSGSGVVVDSAAAGKSCSSGGPGGSPFLPAKSGNTSSMLTEGAAGLRKGPQGYKGGNPGGGEKRGRGRPPKHQKLLTQLQVPDTPEHLADAQAADTPQWPEQPSRAPGAARFAGGAAARQKGKKEKAKSKKSNGRTGRPRGRPPKHAQRVPPPQHLHVEAAADGSQGGGHAGQPSGPVGRKQPPGGKKGLGCVAPQESEGASKAAAPEKRKRGRPRKYPREEPGGEQAAQAAKPAGGPMSPVLQRATVPLETPDLPTDGGEEEMEPLHGSVSCTSGPGKHSQSSDDENMCLEDRLLSNICAEVPLPESVDDSNLASMTDSWLTSMAPDSFQAGGEANNDPFSDIKMGLTSDPLLAVLGE